MTTYYANIDNAYVTVGDGSIGNPFNWDDFLASMGANSGSATYLLEGRRDIVGINTVIRSAAATVTMDAKDVTAPPRIKHVSASVAAIAVGKPITYPKGYAGGYFCPIIKNLILDADSFLTIGSDTTITILTSSIKGASA